MPTPVMSADSHVFEPLDLWQTRVERAYRDRAPQLVDLPDGGQAMAYADGTRLPFGGLGSAGVHGRSTGVIPIEEVRAGGYDPALRLDDMQRDGLEAEVLYPSFGMRLFDVDDRALQRVCMRAYNDWVAEYQSADPKRLLGQALLPLDVDDALQELEHATALGLVGFVVCGHPDPARDYATDLYERLWTAIEQTDKPVSLHIFTGPYAHQPNSFLADYSVGPVMVARSLSQMVWSGVFERHPGLRVVSAENDIGWVAHLLQRMDHAFDRKGARFPHALHSGLLPSELFKRNVRCTFMDDRAGVLTLEIAGPELFMWGSDYPHDDSTFPESQEVIERVLGDVPAEVRRKVVYDNAANWFGLE